MTVEGQSVQYTELAKFEDYGSAQALVDKLSDAGFEVRRLRIVGNDLHSVEQVTGRLTVGKAALLGAGSGAWFGVLIGLFFGLFSPGASWISVLLAGLLIGAGWGAIFGAVAHSMTRGRRDFTSVKVFEAASYTVMVDAAHSAEAARLMGPS
ncbi:general stress protein [Lysobacter korlensis]|uniref:General stress protein n=1 Tax=Lysobacter korlensis TaxID=553636 RepID=A0ABV6RQC2_9GAMM